MVRCKRRKRAKQRNLVNFCIHFLMFFDSTKLFVNLSYQNHMLH